MSGMLSTPVTPAGHLEEHAEDDHVMVKQGTAEGVRGFKTSTYPGRIVEVVQNEQREITHYVVKKFIVSRRCAGPCPTCKRVDNAIYNFFFSHLM